MKHTKKIYPQIESYEHIVSYKSNNKGNLKKTIDLTKSLKGKRFIIKGNINGNPINITKKVRFPIDVISPNKVPITSKKNSFIPSFRPHSILKYPKKKTVKTRITQ